MSRKDILVSGEIYHVFNKSIAGYKIFNTDPDYSRITAMLHYFNVKHRGVKFANFIKSENMADSVQTHTHIIKSGSDMNERRVEIIAYCIMPTHLHLILRQLSDKGISSYMSDVLNSYTRYFNIKQNRKGPLWESRFKNVLVQTDGQLQHLTRYIHLNPVTSYLVDSPEIWHASSYNEYLSKDGIENICKYEDVLDITPDLYRKFVEDRVTYQRDLKQIKDLILE